MSRLWSVIIDLIVRVFRFETRLAKVEVRIGSVEQEVGQLASEVKELRDELHPKDLSAVVWHVGAPEEEREQA